MDKPRQPNDEVVIHAMCAEFWVGSEPIALTQPQHTFGLPPRLVKDYARQLLEALYQQYGNGRRSGFERFAREEQHAIAQCPVRPCSLMTQWEEGYRDPIVEHGFFADVVRQTMAVDFSDLMEPARPRQQRTKLNSQIEGSIVAPVEKAAVLAMVDQLEANDEEAQKQQVLAIAHVEDVTGWTEAIAQWLQTAPDRSVSIAELGCELEMLTVEVWLGVLFGNFQLQQWGEFYQSPVWVTCLSEQALTRY
jgi:hypothetical protein